MGSGRVIAGAIERHDQCRQPGAFGLVLSKDSLLSGPAGGVVGAAHQALQSGIHRMIAFDMVAPALMCRCTITATIIDLNPGLATSVSSPLPLSIETIAAGWIHM